LQVKGQHECITKDMMLFATRTQNGEWNLEECHLSLNDGIIAKTFLILDKNVCREQKDSKNLKYQLS
jgi:hypothetical protein